MKFDPGSFYLGVVDFFSIMLPGGVLAWFLAGPLQGNVFGTLFPAIPPGTAGWVIFLFAAYLLGHIVFLLGSYLDNIYDPIRKLVWPKATDFAYQQADRIKRDRLGAEAAKAINTYQWSRAILTLNHPAGMAEVARLEADSKFFRSLVVVLVILLAATLANDGHRTGIVFPVLLGVFAVLSYWRYTERRYKSTEQAYRFMIVLAGDDSAGAGRPEDAA
tara:strand:+ start:2160 stop:2813 length:654 start_codon:yes stop_codon:yes gene_type:complete